MTLHRIVIVRPIVSVFRLASRKNSINSLEKNVFRAIFKVILQSTPVYEKNHQLYCLFYEFFREMHESAIVKNKIRILKLAPTISKTRFLAIYQGSPLSTPKKCQKTEVLQFKNGFHFLPLLLIIHSLVVFIKILIGYPG